MIEKFNGIFYLILFSIHFLGLGFYAYQMIVDNKRYREKFQIDNSCNHHAYDRCNISWFFFDGFICDVCETKWC